MCQALKQQQQQQRKMKSSAFGILPPLVACLVIFSDDCTGFQTTGNNGNVHCSLLTLNRRCCERNSSRIQRGAVQQKRTFAATVKRTKTTMTTTTSPTRLFSVSDATPKKTTTTTAPSSKAELDVEAIVKYGGAIAIQLGLLFGIFKSLDWLVATFNGQQQQVPFAVNFLLFYLLALKSRIFNPLANTRPKPSTLEIEAKDKENENVTTIRPSWTPPGFIFPIMWLLIIGPIRAVTSAMVYASTGSYACIPIMSLMLHLSIGDVWNTINNVERRYGASVIGVALVWLSKANAAYQYMQVDAMAGKILALTLIWLTIASALITRTWQLNPDPATGKPEPLYPVKGKVKTRYIWFQQ